MSAGPDRTDAPGEALGALIDLAHHLHPDDLPDAVAETGRQLGGRGLELWFVDLAQEVLIRPGSDPPVELDIDATMAGRCYRTTSPVAVEVAGGRRWWIPLLDGSDRLGVLAVVLDDGASVHPFEQLAGLTAELLIARAQYGDNLMVARRRRPLTLASELRWAMLPPRTFNSRRLGIAGVLEPAYEVAGDAFDFSVTGDVAHLAVFDAMGHGLEAARIANLAVAAYRYARRDGQDLLATYGTIDTAISGEFGDSRFATGALLQLTITTGTVRFLLAGHPQLLLLRQRQHVGALEVRPTLPFGIGDVDPVVGEVGLEPDDRVLLYTDGVVEARSVEGEPFGSERLAEFLVKADSSQEPLGETMRRLSKTILAHHQQHLADDATLLLVHWPRPAPAA